MQLVYRIVLALYHNVIRLSALLGNPKAKAWVAGRRDWLGKLDRFRAQRSEVPLIWMHCSSLGEFEQGQPVLEHLRRRHPDHLIALTFYSPSGYEKRKDYEGADWVGYLPPDNPSNARQWVATLRPNLAVFVKYEFWHFHLSALHQQNIPIALIAGAFRPDQIFFRFYGAFFRRLLHYFDLFAVQTTRDRDLLDNLHLPGKIVVTGDPRVDRTLEIATTPFSDPLVEAFAAEHYVLVAGSSWPADEKIFMEWLSQMPPGWKLLLAPHELSPAHIDGLMRQLPPDTVRYTQSRPEESAQASVLVLDTIGMLNKVYRYGRIAYIGGGLGAGIHNTLEPMAYHLPVLFGPKYQKFPEAVTAVQTGAADVVRDSVTFTISFLRWCDPGAYQDAREAVRNLMEAAHGAAERTNTAIEALLSEAP